MATRLNYESPNETDCILNQTWNLSNLLHHQDFKNILTQEKRVNRDIFGQTLRMEDVLPIYYEQNLSFFAII